MKRTLIAAAALALSAGAVQAQNVTLYGLIDAGVERLDHVGAGDDTLYRMPTIAGSAASRWGLRGSEDLGGGLKAVFTLESGFGADSGVMQQGNRLFGRQAFVGLSSDWGTVSLGRQYSMLLLGSLSTDLFLAQIYGAGAFDLFLAGPRVDNALAYQGKFGGLTLGALYSLGRDANTCAGERGIGRECHAWSAVAKYDASLWGVAAWIDEQRGLQGGANTPPTANLAHLTDQRAAVNGYVMLGKTKLAANYMRRDNETAAPALQKSTLWSLAVAHPLTDSLTFEAQYYDFAFKDNDNDGKMLALRATYAFSKRTAAYVTLGALSNDGAAQFSPSVGLSGTAQAPAPGENQTGVMAGLRHAF
ncbi:porin [Caldimonas sp. KR1-144]|uniref:porin n=1 Tax=Caldimonas sp. KR1-144 TaxID=3400911 RepID=UPI003BFDF472